MKYFKMCLILGSVLATLFFFQNCQKNGFNVESGSTVAGNLKFSTISSVKYYRGGYYPAHGDPGWSHDMSIDFNTMATNFPISAEHPDQLCFRSGSLPSAEAAQLLNLIDTLNLAVSAGPVMADAGIEIIEINMKDGTSRKYHLMSGEVPQGEHYALNPKPLSDFLKSLHSNLAIGCQ